MKLEDARELAERLINSGNTHQDYKRTVDLANDYKIYITGKNIGEKLRRFVPRESEVLFAQRIAISIATTPAVTATLKQPFSKVTRTQRIKKNIRVKNPANVNKINEMIDKFYGSARKKDKGLDYWFDMRFKDLSFSDPNAWIAIEWDAAELNKVLKPRPVEIPSSEAVNFKVVNDEVQWLFVRQSRKFKSIDKAYKTDVPGVVYPADVKINNLTGAKYILYDADFTLVYEQIDREHERFKNYQLQKDEIFLTINNKDFLLKVFEPKVGYPTVVRIGYKRDSVTNERTFVNPWHDAECFLEKMLKNVSEFDLTTNNHVFPQKFQYVTKCNGGTKTNRCRDGKLTDGTECTNCKGTGIKFHTTAGDAVTLPIPDNKEDMLDLNGLLVYKGPPIELVEFQNKLIAEGVDNTHKAVFNSQVFIRKGSGSQTATENENNYESVYDTLEPYTENISAIYRDFVTTFAILTGEVLENINITHEFNPDFKLKTQSVLLTERKGAIDSGAPAFIIETIDEDLAALNYMGDDLGFLKFNVKRKFYPFMGSSPDEVAALVASQYVPDYQKVLYSNFDSIFKEIERENPGFWTDKSFDNQKKMVDAKVVEYQERLKSEKPAVTIDTFRFANSNQPGQDEQGQGENITEDEEADESTGSD